MKKLQTGELLKLERKKKLLTREALAEKVGVSATTIQRWETGDRGPSFEDMAKVSSALSVPLSVFTSSGKDESEKEVDLLSVFSMLSKNSGVIEKMMQIPSNHDFWRQLNVFVDTTLEHIEETPVDQKKKA
jgi:transcriptional regulator with XRE-family HTH domain